MASEPVLFPNFTNIPLVLTEEVQLSYIDNHRASTQPPLVLLHDIFDNKSTWFRLAPQLAEYRLIAPDLVGHGFSRKPTLDEYPEHQRYSPDMQTEFLKHFINALNLDSMVLVGNSLGGGLALLPQLSRISGKDTRLGAHRCSGLSPATPRTPA